MRPIPAPRIGDAHGLMRAVDGRGRLRVDEFITEFQVEELFPPELENALGRTRQFVAFARAAGLLREDHGTVELTDIGRRYVRAGDTEAPFGVTDAQAEWLRHLLREKHMTDSIYHGLAITLSLLASSTPDTRTSTLDLGRALSHLGRAGWDNENTLRVQGERHLTLLRDMRVIDEQWALTPTGRDTRDELTLPVHRSLSDLAGQLNPGGPEAVRAEAGAEWGTGEPEVAPAAAEAAPAEEPPVAVAPAADDEYQDVGPGAWADVADSPTVISAPSEAAPAQEPAVAEEPAAVAEEPAELAEEPAAVAEEPAAVGEEPAVAVEEAAAEVAPASQPETDGAAAAPAPEVAAPELAPSPPPRAAPSPPPRVTPARAAPATGLPSHDAIRAAAEEAGLVLPDGLYAQLAAALAAGKHLLLTGAPGSGKTTLALAVARAAGSEPLLVTAQRRWSARDTVGDVDGAGVVVAAARAGRWLVLDELERAHLDRALGPLSSFLGGDAVALPDGAEAQPAEGWRIVATSGGGTPRAGAAVLRRFAHVAIPAAPPPDLVTAAGGDETAAAAVQRLLALRELMALGAGVYLDAARHAAARNAAVPADEPTLAREVYDAYFAPLLAGLDDDARERAEAIAGG